MVEKVDVHVLYCAQGMTNWIEYFADENDTEPSMMAIVDLGGKGSLEPYRASNFIAERLKGFAKKNRKIRIALISHQDNDHWLLIGPFVDAIDGLGVTIGKIWMGGEGWGNPGKNAVEKLREATNTTASKFAGFCSDYDGHDTQIAKEGNCRIRIIVSNAPATDKGSGMYENGTSAMVAVELGGNSVVLPGDATYETMDFADPIFKAKDGPKPCYGLSLPHHGSLRTCVTGYARDEDIANMDFSYVTTFRENLKAKQLVASSGYHNTHKHPLIEIINIFEKYVSAKDTKHYIQAFEFTSYEWYIYPKSTPVWTTLYYKKTIPPKKRKLDPDPEPEYEIDFKDIIYTLKSTGVTAVREVILNPRGTVMATEPSVAGAPNQQELAAHAARQSNAAG